MYFLLRLCLSLSVSVAGGLDIRPSTPCSTTTSHSTKGHSPRGPRSVATCRRALTFVTQYDVELYQRIEALIGKRMGLYPAKEEDVLLLQERVNEAARLAVREMKEQDGGRRKHGRDDDEDATDEKVAALPGAAAAAGGAGGKRHGHFHKKVHRGRK